MAERERRAVPCATGENAAVITSGVDAEDLGRSALTRPRADRRAGGGETTRGRLARRGPGRARTRSVSSPEMAPTIHPGDFTFVHAADLHLDTPFKGVSATSPEVGTALREASLDAFDDLVRLCLDRRAAFLLLAGDLYDGAERGLRAQLRFADGLRRLSEAGIDTFIVHGNHDPVDEGWSAVSAWPARVHVFPADRVEAVEVARDGRVLATVQGRSYASREVTENLALGYTPVGEGLRIGVLHCNVAGAADGYAAYSPCTLDQLRSAGLDYWALGHIHSRMVLAGSESSGGPWVVYPGNLQARSPKPSELGPKGATVVEVRGGRISSVEFVPCDRIRFCELLLDASGIDGVAEVRTALEDLAAAELERADGRSVILRARLGGRTAVHGDLARPEVRSDLLQQLRDDAPAGRQFAWWDRVEDETAPLLDLDALRAGGDFAADLLALADDLTSGGSIDEGFVEDLLSRMPRALVTEARRLLDGEGATAELASRTAIVALDHLEREE